MREIFRLLQCFKFKPAWHSASVCPLVVMRVHLSSGHASHGQDRSEHLNRPRVPDNVLSLPSRYATTFTLLTSFQPPNIT